MRTSEQIFKELRAAIIQIEQVDFNVEGGHAHYEQLKQVVYELNAEYKQSLKVGYENQFRAAK